jgi:hypothetical protein
MGLYGTIVVDPAEPDYWPPADRDLAVTVDDILIEDGAVAPFSRTGIDHVAMGRFGNVMLTAGRTEWTAAARTGEVVRLYLVNTANTRLFNVLRGSPETVIGTSWGAVRNLGITLRPRASKADGGTVAFDHGSDLDVDAVVWATGYRPDYAWLDVTGAVRDGQVLHSRGISPVPGLNFLGLPWQYIRGSALLGFVKDDAFWLGEQLAAELAVDRRALPSTAGADNAATGACALQ